MSFTHFICPFCKTKLKKADKNLACNRCLVNFPIKNGIPCFVKGAALKDVKSTMDQYDRMHLKAFDRIQDGSYEILAAFAKGNKTIDIACGDGYIEELAPNTVGVEFSFNGLTKARRKGARFLVQASAEYLPFADNSFDLAICAGSLEHFVNPERALHEMARVSQIQILTVHRYLPFFGSQIVFKGVSKIFNLTHQPIEKPFDIHELHKLLKREGLSIVFSGTWNFPVNYGKVVHWLPEIPIPSCIFVITYKKNAAHKHHDKKIKNRSNW